MKHNWKYKRLEEISNINMGQSPDSSSYNENGEGLPFFQGCADFGEKYPVTKKYCRLPLKTAEADEILFSVRAPIGTMNYAKEKCCIGRGLCSINPLSAVLQNYLFYVLDFSKHKIIEQGRGSTFKSVGKDIIANHIIPVPPMDVQEQIVAELDKINEIISDCKEAIRNLDALAQSLFYDYFGDPITNPKGWDTVTLGFVSSKISNGANAKIEHDTYKSSGIMFFRCQNVWKNRIDYSDIVYVDEKFNQQFKSSSLKHNDLLVTKIGRLYTENSSLGRVSIYEGEDDKANLSGNLSFIRLTNEVNPQFILYMLISDYFRDYVRNTTTGGIDKRALNNSQLKAFPIFLPPLELQKKFAARIEQIKQQKKCLEETIENMQTLLNSRMDYWFN